MRSLAPKVKTRWVKPDRSVEWYWESILPRYDRILKLLSEDSTRAKKHREELFGTSSEYAYPDLYSMVGLGKELVGSYPQFKEMLNEPKQVRMIAQMIAQQRLQNIVEVIQRHEGIVQRNLEKQEKKQSSNKPAKKARRR